MARVRRGNCGPNGRIPPEEQLPRQLPLDSISPLFAVRNRPLDSIPADYARHLNEPFPEAVARFLATTAPADFGFDRHPAVLEGFRLLLATDIFGSREVLASFLTLGPILLLAIASEEARWLRIQAVLPCAGGGDATPTETFARRGPSWLLHGSPDLETLVAVDPVRGGQLLWQDAWDGAFTTEALCLCGTEGQMVERLSQIAQSLRTEEPEIPPRAVVRFISGYRTRVIDPNEYAPSYLDSDGRTTVVLPHWQSRGFEKGSLPSWAGAALDDLVDHFSPWGRSGRLPLRSIQRGFSLPFAMPFFWNAEVPDHLSAHQRLAGLALAEELKRSYGGDRTVATAQ